MSIIERKIYVLFEHRKHKVTSGKWDHIDVVSICVYIMRFSVFFRRLNTIRIKYPSIDGENYSIQWISQKCVCKSFAGGKLRWKWRKWIFLRITWWDLPSSNHFQPICSRMVELEWCCVGKSGVFPENAIFNSFHFMRYLFALIQHLNSSKFSQENTSKPRS